MDEGSRESRHFGKRRLHSFGPTDFVVETPGLEPVEGEGLAQDNGQGAEEGVGKRRRRAEARVTLRAVEVGVHVQEDAGGIEPRALGRSALSLSNPVAAIPSGA
jgi:hypothetical protein